MGREETLVGQVLQDTYRIDRLIGQGGMGLIYGASHVRLTRRYAIKLLNPAATATHDGIERFCREAEVTGNIGHPHILEVYDFNLTDDGTPYIVMELLEGEDLAQRIERQGRLGFQEASAVFSQTASALGAAHARGVIHRDLKPANIFLCQQATGEIFVKVFDFGLSKIVGSSLTGSHELIGSPYYMAPEQAEQRAADVDVRTDVYGMGIIVYMMLTGRAPFLGETLPALLNQVISEPPPPMRSISAEIPAAIDAAVLVALRKRPDERYQTVKAFWQAFDRLVLHESLGPTVPPPTGPVVLPTADTIGMTVGNYIIRRKLGEGGMGEVYEAEHPELGRQLAVKILASHLLQQEDAVERFVAEARAVARIKHPNVVSIFDFGRLDDGRLYYVMELLEGQELLEVMHRQGPMAPAAVLPYLEQVAAALQAAHGQGIVHRDLKPENIFCCDQQPLSVQVLDFGIAKLLEPGGRGRSVTATGMVMGTPLTMAPEQAAGTPERIGPHTDIYSLGVVLYWMLAGRPPFEDEAAGLLMAKHITEEPPPLAVTAPSVPPAVAAVVHRCLHKDPAARPASAGELAASFAAAIRGAPEATVLGPDGSPLAVTIIGLEAPADATMTAAAVPGPGADPAPAPGRPTTLRAAAGELADDAPLVLRPAWLRPAGLAVAAAAVAVLGMVTWWGLRSDRADDDPPPAAAAVAPVEAPGSTAPTSVQVRRDGGAPRAAHAAAEASETAGVNRDAAAAKGPTPPPSAKPGGPKRLLFGELDDDGARKDDRRQKRGKKRGKKRGERRGGRLPYGDL